MNKEIRKTIEMLPRGTISEISRVSKKSRQAIQNVLNGKSCDIGIMDAIVSVCNRQAEKKKYMFDQLKAIQEMLSKKEV